MERPTSFFSENDAILFAENLATQWPKRIAVNWFWLGFQAMEKAGLTYYETEEEERQVRERLTLMTVFYYEFCHQSAFHESEYFTYWDADFITDLHAFEDPATQSDYLLEIRQALIGYFGNEEKVLAELWINCHEGSSNKFLRLEGVQELYQAILNDTFHHVQYKDAKAWFLSGPNNIMDYEGIAL